ncbi:MAG: hypothetical protein U5L08_15480 [Xanthomonadales bacterium]|nr:hypothetical protein [Xanthomonadales bacterium]
MSSSSDEEHRLPLGRPTLTLQIDVKTRVVTGIAILLEAPSAVSVGMCVSNSMLPKDEYLEELGVEGEWPVWGCPAMLHADNAREFRGRMLRQACENYGIDLQLRPVKVPHYGGHIERLMGTAANELRKLPGATFSNTKQRRGYKSEKEAALTLRELEQQLVDFIVNVYHKRTHSELGMSPLRRWELDLLGEDGGPPPGLPSVPGDPERLKIDFLPYDLRTVQRYGIVLDKVNYYHECLVPWINSTESGSAQAQAEIRRPLTIRGTSARSGSSTPRAISITPFRIATCRILRSVSGNCARRARRLERPAARSTRRRSSMPSSACGPGRSRPLPRLGRLAGIGTGPSVRRSWP